MDATGDNESWGKMFWRVAFWMGFPFGAFMTAIFLFLAPLSNQPWEWWLALGVGMGVGFGLLMAATLVSISRFASGATRPTRVHQQRTVDIRCGREEALQRLLEAMTRVPNGAAPTVDPKSATVVLKTRLTWKSFGEVVSGRVEVIDAESCRVFVDSSPRLPWTLIDLGVSRKNADAVVNALRSGV